jgi:hypothetical protein
MEHSRWQPSVSGHDYGLAVGSFVSLESVQERWKGKFYWLKSFEQLERIGRDK